MLAQAAGAIKEFIKEWGAVLAVPATIVPVICPALGLTAGETALVTVAMIAMLGLALVPARVRHLGAVARFRDLLAQAPKSVLWIGVMILALVCAYLWFYKGEDRWQAWQAEIFAAPDKCAKAGESTDICIAKILTTRPHPPVDHAGAFFLAQLSGDVRAGSILMQHPVLSSRLRAWLGIDTKFLGTGFSVPLDSHDYGQTRVPEALVPNFRDTHEAVWTWVLEPIAPNLKRTVVSVLDGEEPQQVKTGRDFSRYREEIKRRVAEHNIKLPPVVRFAQLTREQYAGCLGLTERWRVFASHLEEVMNLSLEDAGNHSGYSLGTTPGAGEKKLYMMIFVPSHYDEVVAATWRQILTRLEGWSREAKRC